MGKPFWWICCVLICVGLAGCEADHNLVQEPETGYIDAEGYSVGTPYWWRTHPYFKDIKVDEEATLAAGDPYLVIHADEEDEIGPMYDKLMEALIKQFRDEEISHVMGYHRVIAHIMDYHRDYVLSLNIPGVNMSVLGPKLPPGPLPNETIETHCACPWEWEEGVPPNGCESGGGGGGSPPPPPPPDPQSGNLFIWLGLYVPQSELPAQRSVQNKIITASTNGVAMFLSTIKYIRIEKDGVPVVQNLKTSKVSSTRHQYTKTISYGDAVRVVWVSTARHEVTTIVGSKWVRNSTSNIYY